jgi:hypothetical protein
MRPEFSPEEIKEILNTLKYTEPETLLNLVYSNINGCKTYNVTYFVLNSRMDFVFDLNGFLYTIQYYRKVTDIKWELHEVFDEFIFKKVRLRLLFP